MEMKYNKDGKCPICGQADIEYGAAEIVGDFVVYPLLMSLM